jgi:hypothetical protein
LGGNCRKENLVYLTAREHFVAHRLLFLIHTGLEKSKMANAWFRMCQVNKFQKRNISSKNYESARMAFSENNPFKSPEVIKIVRDRMIKNNPMSDPTIAAARSNSQKGKRIGIENSFFEKHHTDKSLSKMRGPRGKYNLTDEYRESKSMLHKDRCWFNNGIKNIKVLKTDERLNDPIWISGRINNCNLGRPKK